MDCQEFEEILHDLDRPGIASAGKRESALDHAESCSTCGRLLTEAEALDFLLHTMAVPTANTRAPLRLEGALLREFRKSHAARKHQRNRWYVAVMGIAALALVVIGLARVRRDVKSSQRPSGDRMVAETATAVPNPSSAGANSTADNDSRNELASSEEGTGFVRLPSADEAASLEGGAVIRVTVPGSALASWGLPVSGVVGTDRIPAELVVSADGMPQAIRLISSAAD